MTPATTTLTRTALQLVGAGPDEAELRALADELGISGRVEFCGWLGQPELAARHAAADI